MLELMHACKECVSTTPLPVGLTTTKQERNSNRRTLANDKILIAGRAQELDQEKEKERRLLSTKFIMLSLIVNTLF